MITLATLSQATPMEVFLQAKNHMLTQGKRCAVDGYCVYRFEGLKCVGGCFISDEEYNKSMEGHNWDDLASNKIVPQRHRALIARLQRLHDSDKVEVWESLLSEVERDILAGRYN